jgi:type II secretory pathway pseudopilin PulG
MRGARGAERQRATTLLEMLVVVAVVGILVSMLLPSFKRSLRMAATTICMHNLRSFGQALEMYRDDNRGWLPASAPPLKTALASGSGNESWFHKIVPHYLNDPMVLTCPDDPFRFRMLRASLRDPNITEYPSYGLNSFVLTANGGTLADVERRRPARPLNTILAADMGPDQIGGLQSKYGSGPPRNSSLLATDDGYDPWVPEKTFPWLTTRHGTGIHMLTMEGGVRSAHTKDTVNARIQTYYQDCAAGGCGLCQASALNRFVWHYSFASDSLYWWTGAVLGD